MNAEIAGVINRARLAQRKSHTLTPDEIDMDTILLTAITYNERLGGFVARKNTYHFKEDLKKAGFIWLSSKKAWFKPVAETK